MQERPWVLSGGQNANGPPWRKPLVRPIVYDNVSCQQPTYNALKACEFWLRFRPVVSHVHWHMGDVKRELAIGFEMMAEG